MELSADALKLLAASKEASRVNGEVTDPKAVQSYSDWTWVPFSAQKPVTEEEKVFRIQPLLYLASEYGARSYEVIRALNIGGVINISAGERRVPNMFEGRKRTDGQGEIEYLHCELQDLAGADLNSVLDRALPVLSNWQKQGVATLVHCSAGLSRSASVVLAYIMMTQRHTLAQTVDFVTHQRGRRLQVNPSFWMVLAARERELHCIPAGTTPSFDFTPWWIEDFSAMGFPAEKIVRCLHIHGDWVNFQSAFNALLA